MGGDFGGGEGDGCGADEPVGLADGLCAACVVLRRLVRPGDGALVCRDRILHAADGLRGGRAVHRPGVGGSYLLHCGGLEDADAPRAGLDGVHEAVALRVAAVDEGSEDFAGEVVHGVSLVEVGAARVHEALLVEGVRELGVLAPAGDGDGEFAREVGGESGAHEGRPVGGRGACRRAVDVPRVEERRGGILFERDAVNRAVGDLVPDPFARRVQHVDDAQEAGSVRRVYRVRPVRRDGEALARPGGVPVVHGEERPSGGVVDAAAGALGLCRAVRFRLRRQPRGVQRRLLPQQRESLFADLLV